jgi:CheY-like chemotaxis protein
MDGREVLMEIAGDRQLCHLPVVILTTSRMWASISSREIAPSGFALVKAYPAEVVARALNPRWCK